MPLAEIARLGGAVLSDATRGDLPIEAAAPLGAATAGSVSFLTDRKHLAGLAASQAGACFLSSKFAGEVPDGCVALVTDHPQAAWAAVAAVLHPPRRHPAGAPAIHPDAEFEDGVEIGHHVVVGPGARIGRGTRLAAGAVIGPGVAIGRDCDIGPNASVGFALLGDGVKLLANCSIGEAGFGTAISPKGNVDVPQLGRVILQDGVTIGANSTVDRGAYHDTSIGENSKIDNQCHVGHNTQMGRNCLAAAFLGISGSVTVGDGAIFAGRVGVADHLSIGAGAIVAGGSALLRDVPAGEVWSGYPAQPIKRWFRETAWLSRAASRGRSGQKGDGE